MVFFVPPDDSSVDSDAFERQEPPRRRPLGPGDPEWSPPGPSVISQHSHPSRLTPASKKRGRTALDGEYGEPCLSMPLEKADVVTLDDVQHMMKCLNHPNLRRLVQFRGFHPWDNRRRELLWDNADAGSLQAELDAHPNVRFSEAMCWHTLGSLLNALYWLHTGSDYGSSESPPRDHPPIMHNFINPANVLYCNPKQAGAHGHPVNLTCKLGNYSKTKVLSPGYNVVERRYLDYIHPPTYYEAPELQFAPYAPGLKSDVWSVAAVIVRMMGGVNSPDEPQLMERDPAERLSVMCRFWQTKTIVAEMLPPVYPLVLREVLELMLRVDTSERPTAKEALDQVGTAYMIHQEALLQEEMDEQLQREFTGETDKSNVQEREESEPRRCPTCVMS